MPGRASKQKGAKYENELKEHLLALGYHAERVYGSGAIGTMLGRPTHQQLRGDVFVRVPASASPLLDEDLELEVEVKYRRHDFPKWLQALREPARTKTLGFYPGVDVLKAITHDYGKTPSLDYDEGRFLTLLGDSHVLALRYPITRGSDSTGWVIAVPLKETPWKSRRKRR